MNSSIDYADALLHKARDDGYVVRSMSDDADDLARLTPFWVALRYDDSAGEDEPAIQRTWATDAVFRTLDWAAAGGRLDDFQATIFPSKCFLMPANLFLMN